MSDRERLAEVRRWLRYAHDDLTTAGSPDVKAHQACFLAQQAAEKALKAVLVYLQMDVPFVHNLNALRNTIPTGWQLKVDHPDLSRLTSWAVLSRYPTSLPEPTETDARETVGQARAVWQSVVRDLAERGFVVETP